MSPRGGKREWEECAGTGSEVTPTLIRSVGQSRGPCPVCGKEVPVRNGRAYRHKAMVEGGAAS